MRDTLLFCIAAQMVFVVVALFEIADAIKAVS